MSIGAWRGGVATVRRLVLGRVVVLAACVHHVGTPKEPCVNIPWLFLEVAVEELPVPSLVLVLEPLRPFGVTDFVGRMGSVRHDVGVEGGW